MSQESLLIATKNKGKAREFARLLGGFPVRVTNLSELHQIEAPEESGVTFLQNAIIKATYYAERSGMIALADDSGLEVDALSGRPGVYSARYGGDSLSDAERAELVLRELSRARASDRSARFKCVVAIAGMASVQGCVTADGVVEGRIAHEARGENGFGYDPIFVPLGENRTTAEMSGDEKNYLSHRGRAIAHLKPKLIQLLQA